MNRYILKIILALNFAANTFAAITPASHDEVLLFKDDQGIDTEIRRHISTCGGFHALALFKVAADVLSGKNSEAEIKIKKYFNKDNIIGDLTRIVQAVRLGRGYKDGLRSDMNVPTYAMEGYRENLNTIGGFINKDSELATSDHIHTTQKGANFSEHLRLTHQYLYRSTNVSHPRFIFNEAVVVAPVSIKGADPVIVTPVTIVLAPLQVKAAVNSPAADLIEEKSEEPMVAKQPILVPLPDILCAAETAEAVRLIAQCRGAERAGEPISKELIHAVARLYRKYTRDYYAQGNIQEILNILFADPDLSENIRNGIDKLWELPEKLLKVESLGKFFTHMKKQLGLTGYHLVHLISALAYIPAEFAPEIIQKCLKKTFYYGRTPIDDRIREAMYPIVTECLETPKEFEFQEFLSTLDVWNMSAQKSELLYLLRGDLYSSVRCEDALRWLNECSQERRLTSFVDYFKGKVESEGRTLKPLTGANSSFLHLLARTFYTHESVQFTKKMALAMRSMDFDTYPSESQFVAFRDVYLKLIGRVYYPEYTRSQSPKLLKQLYAASNKFSNCEEMLRLLNQHEGLVLADVEVLGTKTSRPMPSGLVPNLLVKSRAMVMDSLCKIGEQNVDLITFANDTLCQDFFDADYLVNFGPDGSETKPYERAYNSPLGYGRASCNTWNRAQVMEAVARNAERLRNPNRQQALGYFIHDGAIGEQRAWIVEAFCEVPDSVINSPDFQSFCQRVAERDSRPKMMQCYTAYYNKKGNLGLIPAACINMYEKPDITDAQQAVIVRDLVNLSDSADPACNTEYVRRMSDDPRFEQYSDDKRIQLYAYLFYAAEYKHEALPVNQHTVSGRTSLIRPVSRIAPTPSIIVRDENDEQVYAEAPLDFGGHEIVDEYGNITYIPDPMHKARIDWVDTWIERGRAQLIVAQ